MATDGESFWPVPAPAIITQPANGLTGLLASLALTITLAAPVSPVPVTGAQIEIRTGPNGSGSLVWSNAPDAGVLSLIVPALTLLTGRTYYIRARFLTASETGAWSADVMIKT